MSTRLNQEILSIGTPGAVAASNTRLNQLALMLLVPAVITGQRVQLIGGPFQDALGNALANGYLILRLQHDAVNLIGGQVVGNISIRVPLDGNGDISAGGSPVFVWPNDVLLPSGGTYQVWAYDANNRLAWDNPQIQRVLSSPNPFNVNAWVPGP